MLKNPETIRSVVRKNPSCNSYLYFILVSIILSCQQPTTQTEHHDLQNCPPKEFREYPAVELANGQKISQNRFVVYFFIGHSNMAQGGSVPESTILMDKAWYYAVPGFESIKPLDPEQANATWFNHFYKQGPGPNFVSEMAKKHPGYFFGAVQNARTAGSIYRDYSPGQDLYEEIIRIGKELKGMVTFGGVVAMIGIYEAQRGREPDGMDSSSYLDRMKDMIEGIRCELSEPELPLFIGELEKYGSNYPLWPDGPFIDSAIWQIPSRIAHSYVIPCNGIPYIDGHHFTLEGQNIWAHRVIDTLEAHKLLPDPQCRQESLKGPENFRISSLSDSSITFTWDHQFVASSFIDSYHIALNGTTQSINGKQNRAEFPLIGNIATAQLSSVDACGNVSIQSKISFSRDSITVPLPAIIDSSAQITDSSATIYWHQQENSQFVSYNLVDKDGKIYASALHDRAVKISNLTSGKIYIFRIESVHALSGVSSYSGQCTVTTVQSSSINVFPFSVNCGGSATGNYLADKEYYPGAPYGYTKMDDFTECKYDTVTYGAVFGTARIAKVIRYLFRVPESRVYRIILDLFDAWGSSQFDYNESVICNNNSYLGNFYFFDGTTRLQQHQNTYLAGAEKGLMAIELPTIQGRALLNGISIDTIPVYTITAPSKSDTVHNNDTVNVKWICDYLRATTAVIKLSTDLGKSWKNISGDFSVEQTQTPEQSFKVKCYAPDLTGTVIAIIKVSDYSHEEWYSISERFILVP